MRSDGAGAIVLVPSTAGDALTDVVPRMMWGLSSHHGR